MQMPELLTEVQFIALHGIEALCSLKQFTLKALEVLARLKQNISFRSVQCSEFQKPYLSSVKHPCMLSKSS